MAKVVDPTSAFDVVKRQGSVMQLRNRKEGKTVSMFSVKKLKPFFVPEVNTSLIEHLKTEYDLLPVEEKENWRILGEAVFLPGKQLFIIEGKKQETTGLYGVALYAGSQYNGIVSTLGMSVYGLSIYGDCKYGSS